MKLQVCIVLQWQSALSDERNAIEVDVSTALLLTRNHAGQTSLEEAAKHGRKEVKKLLDLFESVLLVGLSVESNGCLAVKPKIPKMSYAEAARVSDVVKTQDRLIANGYDPTTSLDRLATTGPNRPKANDEKPITGLVNLDIKKK